MTNCKYRKRQERAKESNAYRVNRVIAHLNKISWDAHCNLISQEDVEKAFKEMNKAMRKSEKIAKNPREERFFFGES